MKIAIATGIYPPEVGGHSFYVESLENSLKRQGHDVTLVLYGRLKKFPTGIRHLLYAVKLWWKTWHVDGVIAFDTFSVAIPAGLVALISDRKILNRAGGDFIWETYIERTGDFIPLPHFYSHSEKWNLKERISFKLIRFALARVHVVFSSSWQRDIWAPNYGFDIGRVHVIENAIEPAIAPLPHAKKNYLFYTRPIALKNHEAFARAFANAKLVQPDIELEEGMVSHGELLERMRSGYAIVLPSISEITPNLILESIRCGKPFLLTKYSGYAAPYKDYGVLVDPLNEDDMTRGILELADEVKYEALIERIRQFNMHHSYDDIAREYVALFKTI